MSSEINQTDKSLGLRIKTAREKASLTQDQLALQVGIAKETLSKYENGHRTPDAAQLNRMVNATGCDPAWLLTGQEPSISSGTDFSGFFIQYGNTEDMYLLDMIRKLERIFRAGDERDRWTIGGLIIESHRKIPFDLRDADCMDCSMRKKKETKAKGVGGGQDEGIEPQANRA